MNSHQNIDIRIKSKSIKGGKCQTLGNCTRVHLSMARERKEKRRKEKLSYHMRIIKTRLIEQFVQLIR